MAGLLILSLLIALVFSVPAVVQGIRARTACGGCRYDLAGLVLPCQCPECGALCTPEHEVRERTWSWRVVPRVLVAMVPVALAPVLPAAVYAILLMIRYPSWNWDACWFQSADRELGAVAAFGIPFAANAVLLTMRWGSRPPGAVHPRFWQRLIWTNICGVVGLMPFAFAAYASRFRDGGGLLHIPAFFGLLAMIAAGWLVVAWPGRTGGAKAESDGKTTTPAREHG